MAHTCEMSWGKRLIATMVLNLIIPAVQTYGRIVSGSMALVSDVLHKLSDFTSAMINYAALRIGRCEPTPKHTLIRSAFALFTVTLLFCIPIAPASGIAAEPTQCTIIHSSNVRGHLFPCPT